MSNSYEERRARVERVKRQLAKRATEVARFLFPKGYRSGSCWRIGDKFGNVGTSLSITLEGDYAGRGKDYATGAYFHLLDLWISARGVDFPTALIEIGRWCRGPEFVAYREAKTTPVHADPLETPTDAKIMCEFFAGAHLLSNHSFAREVISNWRGWPPEFVLSIAKKAWIALANVGPQPGVAFPVRKPVLQAGKFSSHFIGVHQRFGIGPGSSGKWSYRPNKSQNGRGVPALPFVLGDFSAARLLVFPEGQWDALTIPLLLDCEANLPDGLAIIGLRGSTTSDIFLKHYGPFWPPSLHALILPHNDLPGETWVRRGDRNPSFLEQLEKICPRVEVLRLSGVNDVNDAWRASTPDIALIRDTITSMLGGVA